MRGGLRTTSALLVLAVVAVACHGALVVDRHFPLQPTSEVHTQSSAIELFVSPDGNDANNGTSPASSLRTLQAALARVLVLRPEPVATTPVTITLAPGVYVTNETVSITSAHSYLRVRAANGPGSAKLWFGQSLSWHADGATSGVAVADVSAVPGALAYGRVLSLFAGNSTTGAVARRRMTELSPQASLDDYWRYQSIDFDASPVHADVGQGTPAAAALAGANLDSALAYVYHSWTSSLTPIGHYNATTHQLVFSDVPMPDKRYPGGSGRRFRVVNALAADTSVCGGINPGAFHFDAATKQVRYCMTPEESIETLELFVPVAEYGLLIERATDVAIEGVDVAMVRGDVGACIHRQSCDGQSAAAVASAAIQVVAATNVSLASLNVTANDANGVYITEGSRRVELVDSFIGSSGAGGVRIGENRGGAASNASAITQEIYVAGCNITLTGQLVESGAGVLVQMARDVTVAHNNIYELFYTGVSLGWTWDWNPTSNSNNHVLYNRIWSIGRSRLSDMGCVYVLGASPDSVIDHNVCHDVQSYGYGGNGLYTDQASRGYIFTNNVVFNCHSAQILQHFGLDNRFQNNVLADPMQATPAIDTHPGVFGGLHVAQAHSGWEGISSLTFAGNIVQLDSASQTLLEESYHGAFANMTMERNCYWSTKTPASQLAFPTWGTYAGNTTFAAWQALGKDVRSVIADPMFQPLPEGASPWTRFDRLSPKSRCLSVFTPINTTSSGWQPVRQA